MITFTLDQWYGWISTFLWPFTRLLALIGIAPLFGESSAPRTTKIGLAAVLAVAIAPSLPPMPAVSPGSLAGLWILAQQVFIGIAMGFCMRICFAAVQTAGDFVGLQMGLSLATIFDPTTQANTEVLARLFNILAMLTFLSLNVHLLMLGMLIKTFTLVPIGTASLHSDGWLMVAHLGTKIFSSGLLLALPLLASLLAIQLALGILNRAAPQLSVFAVGFPITLSAGVILLAVALPKSTASLGALFQEGVNAMERLATLMAG
ncbi:flagellar biosynthetic protein FliR [Bordetella genomosp. 8]|uniref:Flagellar biosynthetic protein FliR n=1 Tax=Bordetella genomosp. 8 TaxID=1416806 RepID=A0A1W6YKF6_9BORD|nr:flagellar biosynthetic protein FliR [Bordetella genomosp. 8]ARP81449.1 flagellar biosynthetic protein FliR [Bordetella genomosp. 8]